MSFVSGYGCIRICPFIFIIVSPFMHIESDQHAYALHEHNTEHDVHGERVHVSVQCACRYLGRWRGLQ